MLVALALILLHRVMARVLRLALFKEAEPFLFTFDLQLPISGLALIFFPGLELIEWLSVGGGELGVDLSGLDLGFGGFGELLL